MMRPNGVEKQVRPTGWQPGANTLLYLPLENDTLDHSGGTAYNPTGSITFTTLSSGKKVGYINGNNFLLNSDFPSLKMDVTVSFWINPTSQRGEYQPAFGQYKAFSNHNIWAFCRAGQSSGTNFYFGTFNADTGNINVSGWNLITITYTSSGTVIVYKNGKKVATRNSPYNGGNGYQIGGRYDTGSSRTQLTAYMSEIFVENKVRTAQEISDYYNLTKGEYHEEVIFDFTQSDYGFAINSSWGGAQGRDSNGFYKVSDASWGGAASIGMPASLIAMGTPKMIKLHGGNLTTGAGVGISEGVDSKTIRVFYNQLQCVPYSGTGAWGTPHETNVSPLNEDVFVIDFENEICYLESSPSITATIYPSTVLTLWSNNTLNLCVLSPNKNNYGYLRKAEFYF